MAGAENNAQRTIPAKAHRCVEVVKIGDSSKSCVVLVSRRD